MNEAGAGTVGERYGDVEQILECYARDIRRWTTVANVERAAHAFRLDLLATDPHAGTKYRFETGVLGSSLYGMVRANCYVLRNRADKFIETETTHSDGQAQVRPTG